MFPCTLTKCHKIVVIVLQVIHPIAIAHIIHPIAITDTTPNRNHRYYTQLQNRYYTQLQLHILHPVAIADLQQLQLQVLHPAPLLSLKSSSSHWIVPSSHWHAEGEYQAPLKSNQNTCDMCQLIYAARIAHPALQQSFLFCQRC